MEVVLVLIGFAVGIGVSAIVCHRAAIGIIRVDKSDPTDGPYLFLELDKPVRDLICKRYVILRVSVKNFISHK